MIVVLSIIITFAFLVYKAFIQKILKEKTQQHKQQLEYQKEITRQYNLAQENERMRIAEMLHDDVGNKLNILSLWINNEDTWNNERSKEIVTQQIPVLINATRNISHALYPANLEKLGLLLTIEELMSNLDSSISVRLILNHEYHKRPITFEIQVYRIIQEFLTNVIKHSKGSEMNIQIRDTNNALSIILSDNGIGFDQNELQKGMGLRNIETRIQSISASYKWKSKKNNGCQLIIVILKKQDYSH